MLIYYKISFLLGAISAFLIAIFVFYISKNSGVRRKFFMVSLLSSLWSLGFFSLINSDSLVMGKFWRWFMECASILLPAFWLDFIFTFLGIRDRHKRDVILTFWVGGFIWILNSLDLFLPGIFTARMEARYAFKYYAIAGVGYYLFFAYFSVVVLYSLLQLYIEFKKNQGVKNSQIKNIMFSAVVGFGGGGMTFLPTIGIPIQPYGIILFTFYPILITYTILRYRFMDIRAIIFRSIAFGFILLFITSIFAVISTVITTLYAELIGIQSNTLAGLIVALLVTLFYMPTRNLIERATNTILYKKSYDPDKLLSEVSSTTSSTLDLNLLLKKLSEIFVEAFHCEKFGVALVDKNNRLKVAYKTGFAPGIAEGLVNFPRVVSIMNQQLKQNPGVQVIDELYTRHENGEYKPISPILLKALHDNDIGVVTPLYVKERLIGLLILGAKKSGDPYNTRDINILNIIYGQAAVAIENAKLYEEQKRFAQTLKEEVKKATVELRRANKELKKIDATKSEFISIASHQLRTPLTIIKGYVSMMEDGSFGLLPERIQEQLKKVFIANERMITLVDSLLNISRMEAGRQKYNFQETDLYGLAKEIVDTMSLKAKEGNLKLIMREPEKAIPKVFCDGEKLHEVMMNYVSNALKYTKQGQISVCIKPEPQGMITFAVKDTGMGISKENMTHLFKKFSRGEGTYLVHTEGTGLGLYVAKKIVEAHEGKTWAESKGAGKGSTFYFTLPIKGPKKLPGDELKTATIKTPEQLKQEARI